MYKFKQERYEEIINKYKISYIAKIVGISRVYLSYILHNKKNCRKNVAYFITKTLDKNKEIEYYFTRV